MGLDAEREAFEAPILETYEREGSPYFATARLWDDGVIDPLDTRQVLAMGIEAALGAPDPGEAASGSSGCDPPVRAAIALGPSYSSPPTHGVSKCPATAHGPRGRPIR